MLGMAGIPCWGWVDVVLLEGSLMPFREGVWTQGDFQHHLRGILDLKRSLMLFWGRILVSEWFLTLFWGGF